MYIHAERGRESYQHNRNMASYKKKENMEILFLDSQSRRTLSPEKDQASVGNLSSCQ
jgi:hypothetical protein